MNPLLVALIWLAAPEAPAAPVQLGPTAFRAAGLIRHLDVDATRALVVDEAGAVWIFALSDGAGGPVELRDRVHGAALMPEGFVAIGGSRRDQLWRARSAGVDWKHQAGRVITAVEAHGDLIAYGLDGGDVFVARDGAIDDPKRVGNTGSRPRVLRFSPDGARLLATDDNKVARVFDVATGAASGRHGTLVADLDGLANLTEFVDFDGAYVAGGCGVRDEVGLMKVGPRGTPIELDMGLFGGPVALSDTLFAAAQGADQHAIHVWSRAALDAAPTVISTDGVKVRSLRFAPSGRLVAAMAQRVAVFDVNGRVESPATSGPSAAITALAFSADGRSVWVGSDQTIFQYDAVSGREVGRLAGPVNHPGVIFIGRPEDRLDVALHAVRDVVALPDGTLYSAGDDNQLSRWVGGKRVAAVDTGDGRSHVAAAGAYVVSADSRGRVIEWPPALGKATAELDVGFGAGTVAVRPDGRWVAADEDVTTVGRAGKAEASVEFGARDLAWVGREIVVCSRWDLMRRNERLRVLSVLDEEPCAVVAVSPDGALLAAATTRAGVISLWRVPGWIRVGQLPTTAPVTALAFSPDGASLAVGRETATAEVWPVSAFAPR